MKATPPYEEQALDGLVPLRQIYAAQDSALAPILELVHVDFALYLGPIGARNFYRREAVHALWEIWAALYVKRSPLNHEIRRLPAQDRTQRLAALRRHVTTDVLVTCVDWSAQEASRAIVFAAGDVTAHAHAMIRRPFARVYKNATILVATPMNSSPAFNDVVNTFEARLEAKFTRPLGITIANNDVQIIRLDGPFADEHRVVDELDALAEVEFRVVSTNHAKAIAPYV